MTLPVVSGCFVSRLGGCRRSCPPAWCLRIWCFHLFGSCCPWGLIRRFVVVNFQILSFQSREGFGHLGLWWCCFWKSSLSNQCFRGQFVFLVRRNYFHDLRQIQGQIRPLDQFGSSDFCVWASATCRGMNQSQLLDRVLLCSCFHTSVDKVLQELQQAATLVLPAQYYPIAHLFLQAVFQSAHIQHLQKWKLDLLQNTRTPNINFELEHFLQNHAF